MLKKNHTILYFLIFFAVVLVWQQAVFAQPGGGQPLAEEVTPDKWPRSVTVDGAQYTIYQPQLESWDGYIFKGQAAVSVLGDCISE